MFFKYKKSIDSFTKKLNYRLMLYKLNSIWIFTLQGQNVQLDGTVFLLPGYDSDGGLAWLYRAQYQKLEAKAIGIELGWAAYGKKSI